VHPQFFLILIVVATSATAAELPTYYPFEGIYYSNPVTGKTGAFENYNGQKTFLLNAKGDGPYIAGSGEKPYLGKDGKPYVGVVVPKNFPDAQFVKTGGNEFYFVALPGEKLTTLSKNNTVIRTPVPLDRSPSPSCPLKDNNVDDVKHFAEDCDPILTLVKEFHNTTCEKLRKESGKVTQKGEKEALLNEWNQFIEEKAKISKSAKARAEIARAIDITARTTAYEVDDIGNRDKVDPSYCTSEANCPEAACEMQIVALSIKNHAFNAKDKKNSSIASKLLASASNESRYDIWKAGYTTPFLTSCFYKDGLESGNYAGVTDSDKKLETQKNAQKFRLAVKQASLVLQNQDAKKIFEVNGAPQDQINKFENYYHPPAMDGCEKKNYDKYGKTNEAVYVYKTDEKGNIVDASMLVRDWVLPDDPSKTGLVDFKVRKKVLADDLALNPENRTHKWLRFENTDEWKIDAADFHKVETKNQCEDYGIPDFAKNKCSSETAPYSAKVPAWAFVKTQNRPQVKCKTIRESKGYGGLCDTRMQLIVLKK
jgi:hypothetical protein